MPNLVNPKHFDPLVAVTTKAHAARLWGVDPKTIQYAIDAGNIAGLQHGRIWLVSVGSLYEWFGRPRGVAPVKQVNIQK